MLRKSESISAALAADGSVSRGGVSAMIALPYRFDTSSVWRTILTGAFGLNVLLIACVVFSVVARLWPITVALAVTELFMLVFTWLLIRFQHGSVGTLNLDRVDVEPNVLFGLSLPGPNGNYPLDRFLAVRVEFRSGPIQPGVQGGPNEVVWLVGRSGTPNVAIARTDDGAGRAFGQQLAALLELPVEETGAPRRIRINH